MDKFICVGTPIRDEAYCLHDYLSNVKPLVGGVVCVIDSRTIDESEQILKEAGAIYKTVDFIDFAQIDNAVLDLAVESGFKYMIVLNPDERLRPEVFYNLMDFIHKYPDADLIHTARHNWYDLEMTNERTEVFPDLQCKVIKLSNPTLRYVGKVHETVVGDGKRVVAPTDTIFTDHFNLYYYKTGEQNYEKKIEQYNKLARI